MLKLLVVKPNEGLTLDEVLDVVVKDTKEGCLSVVFLPNKVVNCELVGDCGICNKRTKDLIGSMLRIIT